MRVGGACCSRVSRARYDSGLQQVQVVFRDGTPWVYDNVPTNIWRNFRRSASPGRYINRVLNGFNYYQGAFDNSGGDDGSNSREVNEADTV